MLKLCKEFKNYNPEIYKAIIEKLKNPVNLTGFFALFIGVPGSGKTYLANLIMKYLEEKNKDRFPLFLYKQINCRTIYNNYLIHLKGTYSNSNYELAEINKISQRSNLIIDDLGDERPSTEKSHTFIGGLITDIHMNIHNDTVKNCIITTNLSMQSISELYKLNGIDRITSRINEYFDIYYFADYDFRKNKNKIIGKHKR